MLRAEGRDAQDPNAAIASAGLAVGAHDSGTARVPACPQRFQDEAAALRSFAEAIKKVPQAPGLRPALSGGFVSDMLQLVQKP
jgi:hypothetical protein